MFSKRIKLSFFAVVAILGLVLTGCAPQGDTQTAATNDGSVATMPGKYLLSIHSYTSGYSGSVPGEGRFRSYLDQEAKAKAKSGAKGDKTCIAYMGDTLTRLAIEDGSVLAAFSPLKGTGNRMDIGYEGDWLHGKNCDMATRVILSEANFEKLNEMYRQALDEQKAHQAHIEDLVKNRVDNPRVYTVENEQSVALEPRTCEGIDCPQLCRFVEAEGDTYAEVARSADGRMLYEYHRGDPTTGPRSGLPQLCDTGDLFFL